MEEQIMITANDINSNDKDKVIESTIRLRKLLSFESNPPIDMVVNIGIIVPRLVKFLNESSLPNLQFEAAWCLTNIASGKSEHTKSVVDNGAIPALMKLLNETKQIDIIEQVIWAFGCISGDSVQLRDLVLDANVLEYIINVLNEFMSGNKFNFKITTIKTSVYTLSNLLKSKPKPSYKKIYPALPVLAKLLYLNDESILSDTLWALSHYSEDCTDDIIQKIMDFGISKRLVELLQHPLPIIQTPALRIICNLLIGNDDQTQVLLNCNLIPELEILLKSSKRVIRKEVCYALSNITACTEEQIQKVLESKTIVTSLLEILSSNGTSFDIKKEAVWAISNMIVGCSRKQIEYLVTSFSLIQTVCDLLDQYRDVYCLNPILDAIKKIIEQGDLNQKTSNENGYLIAIQKCGGLDKLEVLQRHESEQIYKKVQEILSLFGIEKEYEDDDKLLEKLNI